MSNVAKLKKQAAEFELKKQFDKALAVYVKLLESFDENANELDVALYNRVGDIMLRQGNVADAVDYYEQAIDRYAEGGFFNNAIALCNKVLRHSPGRATVYYKLGKISAQKGFRSDAKQNFLEYADRMQKAGKMDEAFRALQEFADLCPDQDDIRLMLADQLARADRKNDAVEQLQRLYERYHAEGRNAEASATADRMRAIDPDAQPRTGSGYSRKSTSDLVFLDLDEAAAPTPPTPRLSVPAPLPAPAQVVERRAEAPPAPPPPAVPNAAVEPAAEPEPPEPPEPVVQPEAIETIQTHATVDPRTTPVEPLEIEHTSLAGDSIAPEQGGSLLDLEPTQLGGEEPPALIERLELADQPPAEPPAASVEPSTLDDMEIVEPPEEPTASPSAASLAQSWPPVAAAADETGATGGELVFIMPDDEPVPPTPEVGRRSTMFAAQSVEILRACVEGEPDDWSLRRELAEAMLEAGDRTGGIQELETAMAGADRTGDLDLAASLAAELSRLEPETVRHHQKRVEFAFRANDRPRLVEAYLSLAEALLRSELPEKAAAAYQRVLDIAPDEPRALAAIEALAPLAAEPAPGQRSSRPVPEIPAARVSRPVQAAETRPSRPVAAPPRVSQPHAAPSRPPAPRVSSPVARPTPLSPPPAPPHAATPAASAPPPPARPLEPAIPAAEPQPARTSRPATRPDDDFINLGDWLRDTEAPRDTRMIVEEKEPTGDEDADFADMLRKFKQGVAENVDPDDYQSHYDLGIAYKEMGLVDEAIHEFQRALGGAQNRVATYEALGDCFLGKNQYTLASSILSRALSEKGTTEEQLVGVVYLLGRAAEAQGRTEEALGYYHRVFLQDIQFRDVVSRVAELERVAL